MDIFQYIDHYKDETFETKDFNDVDAMIFSFLAYATISTIVKKDKKYTINDVANQHIKLYSGKDKNIIAVKEANVLLRYIKDCERYKNCLLYDYEFEENDQVQFTAFSIEYKKNHVFVTYEGTNAYFSGWKEDLLLAYEFPTLSHKMAISYLNRHFTFSLKHIIVGGHSKGGNLALVAGMYANVFVRMKIKKIYSGDGPGLLKDSYQSLRYKNIQKKYLHIIPNYSVVGVLLNHSNDFVVSSTVKSILSHSIFYWEVEDDSFVRTRLSRFSEALDFEIQKWLDDTSLEDKKEFIHNLEFVLEKANVKTIDEIKENKLRIFNFVREAKGMSQSSKTALSSFLTIILKCIEKTTKEELKYSILSFWRWNKKDEFK